MTVLPDFRQTEFGLQVRLPTTLVSPLIDIGGGFEIKEAPRAVRKMSQKEILQGDELREAGIPGLCLDSLHHGTAGPENGDNQCQNDKSRHPEIVSGDDPQILSSKRGNTGLQH
jgi:hypothetical protein